MITAITAVWTSVATFITGLFPSVIELFYDASANSGAGQLTFIGILAMVVAGVSLLLLVFNLIRSFLVARA